jgi:putative transcriptional regulator
VLNYSLKIKELRKHLSLTQDQFATDLSVSRSIISQIEIGKFNPTLELLNDIARKYNIDANYFFNENFALTLTNNTDSMNCNNCPFERINQRLEEDIIRYREDIADLKDQIRTLRGIETPESKLKNVS